MGRLLVIRFGLFWKPAGLWTRDLWRNSQVLYRWAMHPRWWIFTWRRTERPAKAIRLISSVRYVLFSIEFPHLCTIYWRKTEFIKHVLHWKQNKTNDATKLATHFPIALNTHPVAYSMPAEQSNRLGKLLTSTRQAPQVSGIRNAPFISRLRLNFDGVSLQ